jgi:hypothetical protein
VCTRADDDSVQKLKGRLVKHFLTVNKPAAYGSVVARAQVSGCWAVVTPNTALQPYG